MNEKTDKKLQRLLDKIECIKGELDDVMGEVEETVLEAFDDGNEVGYTEGTESKKGAV